MSFTIISEPERIKRTPNGNTWSMRYAFNGVTYRSYGKSAEECLTNAQANANKMQAELDQRSANSAAIAQWMRDNE